MTKDKEKDDQEVVSWKIENILPYEKNVKIHDADQVNKVVASIEEFGFRGYVTVDENGVLLAGHGRRLAALQMGFKSLPVLIIRDLNEKQKRAYRIADNKTASVIYDDTMLGNEIKELLSATENELAIMDVAALGIDTIELDSIFQKFSIDEISGMIAPSASATTEETKSKPVVKEVEYEKSYIVSIKCSGEIEQLELYNQLKADGRECTVMTM